jgi:hypothetical protein
MQVQARYEWRYEVMDGEDIVHYYCADRLQDFPQDEVTQSLCICRLAGNEKDGVVALDYAYVTDGVLPLFFEGTSYKVPNRYKAELIKYINDGTPR